MTEAESHINDTVPRWPPSDLWLWLIVILLAISAAMAFYRMQSVGIVMSLFGLAALECGRLPGVKFAHVLARYAGCFLVTSVLFVGLQGTLGSVVEQVPEPDADDEGVYAAIEWTPVPRWERIRNFSFFFAMGGLMFVAGLTREVRPPAQLGLCAVLAVVVYPIFSAWSWGEGWLARRGFFDFAGGTVVYSLAGWSAFAVLVVHRRMSPAESAKIPAAAKNPRPWLYVCGGALLWPAGGLPALFQPSEFFDLVLTVNLAAALGALGASMVALVLFHAWRVQFAFIGCLSAVVATTAVPGSPFASTFTTLIIGIAAGMLSMISLWCVDRLGIPDHLGIVSACGVGGAVGTIAAGALQIHPGPPLEPITVGAQSLGAAAFAWAFVVFGGVAWAARHYLNHEIDAGGRRETLK